MIYYAHTKENEPESKWQLLREHLLGTAEIAASFAVNEKFAEVFQLAGLFHDFGKYQVEFQRYLKEGGRRGSVPHASWGAGFARCLGLNEISMAIDGHHKGLPDVSDWKADSDEFKKGEVSGFEVVKNAFISELSDYMEKSQNGKLNYKDSLERELIIRFIFSALVDADWLDTEKFGNPEKTKIRNLLNLNCDLFIAKLDKVMAEKAKEGELNSLRNKVREFALSKAEMTPAFYSLNLPTGMGKTLTSVSWALLHAKKNKLKRIIIVLPYINIIDQTSKILKEIFGDEWILEHHSGYNETEKNDEDHDAKIMDITKRLATENWEFPIIVTTTVQFFESLFSNKRSKCRKIHNIAESVVIFDEVQSLRKEVVLPTLTMLKNINSIMKTSFLFCTATQPAFEKNEKFDGIENIIPLVENCDEIFRKTRRVIYYPVNQYESVDLEELFLKVSDQESSILCIFNTKKSALKFFQRAKDDSKWTKKYHLSTSMCPHHRKSLIESIREDLVHDKKILVSSTQLIEAGVDFDFPCVFREYAPMESIIQSAGRCNREGKMSDLGKVFIFMLEESGMPDKQYKSLSQHALDMIKKSPERLHHHDFFPEYYRSALNLFIDPDKRNIIEAQQAFNFETVAGSYRIIDKNTESLFIWKYNDESISLLEQIRKQEFITREQYRQIQNYSVQVFEYFMKKHKDLYENLPQGVKVWHGKYDEYMGILEDPLDADEFIV